jgi:hypothetical protein
MGTRPRNDTGARPSRSLSARLQALSNVNRRKNKIQDIIDALTSSGYTSLDDQARALGVPRATVWTIRQSKHKLGRLSDKTIERILANPDTPPVVLDAMQEYVLEKLGTSVEDQRRNSNTLQSRQPAENYERTPDSPTDLERSD